MRFKADFPIDDLAFWKKQLLLWVADHEYGVYLDSNMLASGQVKQDQECIAAAGAVEVLEAIAGEAFVQLSSFYKAKNDWIFGFFGYDLKNEVEKLSSQNFDGIELPDLGFFRPVSVVSIKPVRFLKTSQVSYLLEIQTLESDPEKVYVAIKTATATNMPIGRPPTEHANSSVNLQPRIPKSEYLQTVEAIRQHIIGGDVYELNLCQEFFAENISLEPVTVFERLNEIGKAPFSTFLRWRDRYLLCASPERFLKKTGQKLISQPIKGTRRRGKSDLEDDQIRQELATSEKDRAENVMIVDLVRNDLSRNCLPGSVQVEELCGIYTFATVHQMISTVSGVLPNSSLGSLESLGSLGSLGSLESLGSLGSFVISSEKDTERYPNDSMTNDSMTNDPNDSMTNDSMTNDPNDPNDPNDSMTNDSMTNDLMTNDSMTNDLMTNDPTLQALKDTFPMGSMTGAPKVMAMELIEQYERTRRGLYSGAVGYFAPDGDFDFNVVIRSILYNAETRYVSVQVGGAIVYDSVPALEYEECMVKAEAMMRALGAK